MEVSICWNEHKRKRICSGSCKVAGREHMATRNGRTDGRAERRRRLFDEMNARRRWRKQIRGEAQKGQKEGDVGGGRGEIG
jgi:hypothetical protein